ncbi:hypothetical protein ABIF90_007235 [Bradyrhizobium japonicum]
MPETCRPRSGAEGHTDLLPVLLRRGVLPAPPGVRSFLADPLAPAHGEEKLQALLNESLSVATKTEAIRPSDLNRVIVGHHGAAQERDVPDRCAASEPGARDPGQAGTTAGPRFRQSYARVGKFALIKHQRYSHAKQFRRANAGLQNASNLSRPRLRDITRKIEGHTDLLEYGATIRMRAARQSR